ncbi:MAG: hypothetical protein WBG92_01400 [Thiohalocapsa sp.]
MIERPRLIAAAIVAAVLIIAGLAALALLESEDRTAEVIGFEWFGDGDRSRA